MDFSHAYCDVCDAIKPLTHENLNMLDASGEYTGGDLLCQECFNIIVTVYRPLTESEREKLEQRAPRGRWLRAVK